MSDQGPSIHRQNPDSAGSAPNEREQFVELIKDALARLHDFAYLRRHPLLRILTPDSPDGTMARVHVLRRRLIEGIEVLRPAEAVSHRDKEWRPYYALRYHYVDGLSAQQVEERMALGERQIQRERRRGLEALAHLLWEQRIVPPSGADGATPSTGDGSTDEGALLSQEVARMGVERVPTQVRSLVQNACQSVAGLAAAHGVAIECRGSLIERTMLVDPILLRQALVAALSYAVQTGTSDTVRVSASPDDDCFRLAISCLGPRDLRTEATLSGAEALVEAQGGSLIVREDAGQWAVTIEIPQQPVARILLIDDNVGTLHLYQRCLAQQNYHLTAVEDGLEALELAQAEKPDLIVLDVMMRGIDGWEVLQRLKSAPETRDIPVIICTVLKEHSLALSLGAAECLSKPIDRVSFLQAIARCLA